MEALAIFGGLCLVSIGFVFIGWMFWVYTNISDIKEDLKRYEDSNIHLRVSNLENMSVLEKRK